MHSPSRFINQLHLSASMSPKHQPAQPIHGITSPIRSTSLSLYPSPFLSFQPNIDSLLAVVFGEKSILVHILEKMTLTLKDFYSILSVSKLFRDAATYISSLDFSPSSLRCLDRHLVLALQRAPNLVHLKLDGCSLITDNSTKLIAPYCTKLTSASLNGCVGITDLGVSDLLRHSKLTSLSLERVSLTDRAVLEIAYVAPGLKTLSLAHTPVSDVAMSELTRRLLALQRLDLHGCVRLTDATIRSLAQARPTQLVSLDISNCHLITGSSLISLLENAPSLRTLGLRGCHQVSEEVVVAILRGRSALRALDVSWCLQWSEATRALFLSSVGKVRVMD